MDNSLIFNFQPVRSSLLLCLNTYCLHLQKEVVMPRRSAVQLPPSNGVWSPLIWLLKQAVPGPRSPVPDPRSPHLVHPHNTLFKPGFFSGKCHQVAFERLIGCGKGLLACVIQTFDKGIHQPLISTAVPVSF